MKKIIFSIMLFTVAATVSATAQSGYEAVLTQIEANSTTLEALRQQMEAQKIGNRTGIFLSNPEVEFNYLWGNPSAVGNRTDFAVKQSFDFPTAYVHRNQISRLENTNAELEYKAQRIKLLLFAKQTCVELIYHNALAKEYESRLSHARQIAAAYQNRLEKGEVNAIENNKAQLNLMQVQNEVARIDTQRSLLLLELRRMNGYHEVIFTQQQYPISFLPDSFDSWYAQTEPKSPTLQYLSGQINISNQQVKLSRAQGLPKLSAGYMSEKIVGEQFQGVALGVSIPLWESKNKVRQARAQVSATESMLKDSKLQFHGNLEDLYVKAANLKSSATKYREALTTFGNEGLLKKALDSGEISLLSYLVEVEYYYQAVNNVLETEKDFELAVAELYAVEL